MRNERKGSRIEWSREREGGSVGNTVRSKDNDYVDPTIIRVGGVQRSTMYNRFGYQRRTVTMEKQINPSMLESMIEVKKIPIKELEGKKSPNNLTRGLPDTLRNSDIMAVRTQQSMETHEGSAESKKEKDSVQMKPKMNPRPVI